MIVNFINSGGLIYLYIFVVLLLAWLGYLSFIVFKVVGRYSQLTKDVTGSTLKDIWKSHLYRIDEVEGRVKGLEKRVSEIQLQDLKHLQKVGMVRFNPFSDTGGNQSFAIALLDVNGNGVVFSSLHGREGTRVYGKSVKEYKSNGFEFSKEELDAINYAAKS